MPEKIIDNDFKDAYVFGRELHWILSNYQNFPGNLIPKANSEVHSHFIKFFVDNPKHFKEFRLVLFVTPKLKQVNDKRPNVKLKQPKKNQYHWILISDFWARFFNQFLTEFGYRKNSQIFISDFCSMVEADCARWLKKFHIHFVSDKLIGNDLNYWKDFINSQHCGRLTSLLRYEPSFFEFNFENKTDLDLYRGLNYKLVDPADLCVDFGSLR